MRKIALEKKVQKPQAYMWPHLTVEDMMQPNIFLVFLNSRGRHEPHIFADMDLEVVLFGWQAGGIKFPYITGYAMQLHGQTGPVTYGQIIHNAHDSDLETAMVGRAGVDSGCGLKVLQMQHHILKFLHDCCGDIHQDIKDPLSTGVQQEPEALSTCTSDYASLQDTASIIRYRVPTQINFAQLLALARAESDSRTNQFPRSAQRPAAACLGSK
ncbi:hypothetical protein BU23DRAFT_660350 [Bimuria novae-zelandiae CBS 107.79]|uniref:Uncharacterized protein n=1 Tax=Bimuria novae-zelandiae CBS 107.79 TaxID=1447943 RepID=A0A6A5URG4_9PLEO|nr:hypothetical protein BU23DRAFT_660350 [Bimuria novae-zelandiae CBS 107.79]